MTSPNNWRGYIMDELTLKEVKFNNESIDQWECIILLTSEVIIFYKLNGHDKKSGFKFISVEIIGQYADASIIDPENIVNILYNGYALYDGIRHMHLGDNNKNNCGYVYYPELKKHIAILKTLHQLEFVYCDLEYI